MQKYLSISPSTTLWRLWFLTVNKIRLQMWHASNSLFFLMRFWNMNRTFVQDSIVHRFIEFLSIKRFFEDDNQSLAIVFFFDFFKCRFPFFFAIGIDQVGHFFKLIFFPIFRKVCNFNLNSRLKFGFLDGWGRYINDFFWSIINGPFVLFILFMLNVAFEDSRVD